MLKHVVLMDVRDAAAQDSVTEAMTILEGLVGQVDGLLGLGHGPNRDFEGKSARYSYGFVTTFTDRAAHLAYETHPEHQRAGAMLVAACKGGHEGIFVADLEVASG